MNPLSNVLPAKIRRYAYAILFVASLVFAAWQASGQDWTTFAGALITSLFSAVAASNVTTE